MKKIYAITTIILLINGISFSGSSREALTKDEIASGKTLSVYDVTSVSTSSGMNPLMQARVASCDTLTTEFASNNGLSGNMFDLNPLSSIFITGFDVNTTSSGLFFVYYKSGSYVGFETDSTAWIFLDTVNVVSQGNNMPSPLVLNNPLQLTVGNPTALYIFTAGTVRYTDGTAVGTLAASNSDLQIFEGEGCSAHWGVSHFNPRIWNGTIYYCSGTVAVNEMNPVKEIGLYPNPSMDVINFRMPVSNAASQITLQVTDAVGQHLMLLQKNYSAEMQFDISKLASGLYFYTVNSGDGIIGQGKFCKQ
jgi:hypothetical protein